MRIDPDIPENDILRRSPDLLAQLLCDHATGRCILWATHDYESLGKGYLYADEIRPERITGMQGSIIKPRVLKSKGLQTDRSKDMAEVFTPSWVVKKMVDLLEEENPHIFENPQKTFADLYMKSGLYITEIVRRLYNNDEMRRQIPDDRERILHILQHQVYGFAPTEIIYRIATRYILGFDPSLKPEQSNFRQVDTVPYAKEGRMEELIEKEFGSVQN